MSIVFQLKRRIIQSIKIVFTDNVKRKVEDFNGYLFDIQKTNKTRSGIIPLMVTDLRYTSQHKKKLLVLTEKKSCETE